MKIEAFFLFTKHILATSQNVIYKKYLFPETYLFSEALLLAQRSMGSKSPCWSHALSANLS